jgi:RHS repeat-associated protein
VGTTDPCLYDALYRLTSKTYPDQTSVEYAYDLAGKVQQVSDPTGTYNYNTSNELTSNSNGSYSYDANGNTLGDGSKTYTWDFENRLTSVTVPGTGTTTFRYDPFGRRIQKSGPLGTTNYLYDEVSNRLQKHDGFNVIEEVDNSGNVLARYTQGQVMDQTFAELRSGVTSYFEQDGIGSVTSLSNPTAALANTYTYDSFGNLTTSSGSLTNPFRYTTREFDPETGIYHYRARYYDQTIGRFLSEDPMGFDAGINFYGYVKNRPLNMTDPLGLSTIVYDPSGWIYVYDNAVNLLGVCEAHNNTTRTSIGSWPAGSYPYLYHNNHPPDPDGPYGSYGIYIFDRPGCSGCGVHSGRANKGGSSAKTLGCIRTNDACMEWLTLVNAADPITHIVVW